MVVSFEMEDNKDPLASRTTPAIGPSRTHSALYRSTEENAMALLLKVFLFLQAITFNGLGTTVNIYLVVIIGWSPLKASWIWFTRDMVCLVGATPVGAFIDRTEKKKTLLFVAVSCYIDLIRLVST